MAVVPTRILIVEDDSDARAALRELLEDEGFTVVEAANGRLALNYLSGSDAQPGLILLDLVMPEMSGWELVALMRKYSKLARIPVVVTTGLETVTTVTGKGIIGCLKKPISNAELLHVIDAALQTPEPQPG
jgi:CheY-like chemotaxis protein